MELDRPAAPGDAPVRLVDVLQNVVDYLGRVSGPSTGVPSGFRELDRLTDGLRPGALWLVAGRSGVGKSVLALDLARSAAVRAVASTLLVTTDEPVSSVVRRLLAAESRVALHHLLHGSTSDDERARLSRRTAELSQAPLLVGQRTALDATSIRQWAHAGDAATSVRVLVLDHLPHDVGHQQLEDLRAIARDTGARVVAVVEQDVRDEEGQLRRLEQRADVLLELVREDEAERDSPRAGEADIVVHRHREGPTDVITAAFQGQYSRFVDRST